jgi:hypothetical protein
MRGAEGEAVLVALRTLRNKADAAVSARPKGKNSYCFILLKNMNIKRFGIFMNNSG